MRPPLSNFNRTDLVAVLLQYPGAHPGRLSDLLRLDVSTPPTPLASQNRLPAVLGGDAAAWPNGRRPRDDVTDTAIRVVGGPNYINAHAGDGVNIDDAPLTAAFPFLADPADGRDYKSNGVQTPHLNPAP